MMHVPKASAQAQSGSFCRFPQWHSQWLVTARQAAGGRVVSESPTATYDHGSAKTSGARSSAIRCGPWNWILGN